MKETRGRCPACGKELPPGRSDKRFCCDACRSRFYYQDCGRDKRLREKAINSIYRNYEILESLLEDGVTAIDILDLADRGYNFGCITTCGKVRHHDEYRCLDIKYYKSARRIFGLERCRKPKEARTRDGKLKGIKP